MKTVNFSLKSIKYLSIYLTSAGKTHFNGPLCFCFVFKVLTGFYYQRKVQWNHIVIEDKDLIHVCDHAPRYCLIFVNLLNA